jgi:hypothetical protein
MAASDIFNQPSRWTTYEAELAVTTLVGGIPSNPDIVRSWLKARLELGDAELSALADQIIEQMAWTRVESAEQLDELLDEVMARSEAKGNSFLMVGGSLVIEGRQIKAAIKEASNVLYPGITKWPGHPGPHIRKGLTSWLVERVEVVDQYIPLGRATPDIVGQQRVKHVSGPQGKRSTINVVDICLDVKISFTVRVLDDCIPPQLWAELWSYLEMGGIGADRARGDGRSELVAWRKIK